MKREWRQAFSVSAVLSALTLLGLAAAPAARAQMVTGRDMTNFDGAFGLNRNQPGKRYDVAMVASSVPGNILWPGERAKFTLKVENRSGEPIDVTGRVELVAYGTKGKPNDVWTPTVYRIGSAGSVPVRVQATAGGAVTLDITPAIPARFGAYALVMDLGPQLGRQFIVSCVRTFKPDATQVQYPSFSLDDLGPDVLQRLGVHAIRWGVSYKPSTDPDFDAWYADQAKQLNALHKAGITVLAMVGGGDFNHPNQPLRRPRPWLDDKGVMQDTKFDLAWLPSYDPDFQKVVTKLTSDFGWPKGPITALSLWNEPWEGISISGWGADMLRYREIFAAMAAGVDDARRNAGVDVLTGGGDSSSNALDKFFGDGKDTFLPNFDFLSVHYQGMASFATYKPWVNRTGPRGRVRVWDTESWVANTDDRVAAVIAANRSAGYDRAMGVFGGNISDGDERASTRGNAWSVAAAVGAATHFLGERPFRELLFKNGLPWVMVFDGTNGNKEDGTVVVVGDLGEEFGADNVLFRTARGLNEISHKEVLQQQLATLPSAEGDTVVSHSENGKPITKRQAMQKALDTPETLSGATMSLAAAGNRFALYDFYGNEVASETTGRIVVPLDGRGFFLRGNGKPGSFDSLLAALRGGHIDGIEPLAIQAHDLTGSVESHAALRLSLTNILNRPVTGNLRVKLGELALERPEQSVTIGPNETKIVSLRVASGSPVESNNYPLQVVFDAGNDGVAVHHEAMHANVIARRTINVDGDLSDWKGILPETITAAGSGPTLTEAAWFPFKKFDAATGGGLATGYLAYDDNYFYFAAKVSDVTPDGGTLRFANRDDDQYFYPEKSYAVGKAQSGFAIRWNGFITPKESGAYTLSTVTDDGVRVWLNDKPIIDNWTDHGPTEDRAKVDLVAGQRYAVKMEYYQGDGGATAQLQWESANRAKTPIPTDVLTAADGTTPGLTGDYFSGRDFERKVLTRVDPVVNFTWAEGETPDPRYKTSASDLQELDWPEGVRRYSYRKDPVLPSGNSPSFDNVQIAFNVLTPQEKRFYPNPPGTMPDYTIIPDTDYEYALNKVAEQYGGGTEIWRLNAPDMPLKHYYPREPKSPSDGPVTDGKLVVTQDASTRIVEAAIPWKEIPEVKKAMEAGKNIKFSFRVNDNAGVGTMELSRGRSVAKRGASFHADWVEHWENQVEFGWQK